MKAKEYSAGILVCVEDFNDPQMDTIIKERVANLIDDTHRRIEARDVVRISIETRGFRRGIVAPNGEVIVNGEGGAGPWKRADHDG